MKVTRTQILESSLLCLLLFAQGCDLNPPEASKVSQQELPKGHKKMSEMTVEEARKVLQDAEQVLADTKIAVELAKKKHMTLEEMLVADAKARTASLALKSIPSSLFVSGNDISGRYNKLIFDLMDTRSKLITVINTEIYSSVQDIIQRTDQTETQLRSNLESIKKVIDRYPSPDLVEFKDSVVGKLKVGKQVSSEPIEQAIKRIKAELKDVPNYVGKAQETREAKLFDASHKWKMRILENANRALGILRLQYDALLKTEGNTSRLIGILLETDKGIALANAHFNKEHDLSRKEEKEWIKSLSRDAKIAKAQEITTDTEQDILKAREHHKKGNILEAHILYDNARFSLSRSTWYTAGFPVSENFSKWDNFIDEVDAYTVSYQSEAQAKDAQFTRDVSKRLRTIDADLREAEALAKRSDGVLKYYHPMRVAGLVKQASRKDYDSPNVKVSADGKVSPYNKGDELKAGEQVG